MSALTLMVGLLLQAASDAGRLDSADVRRWREDLRWLAREMPAQHGNLFHTMRREQFDSAIRAVDARLPDLARHQVIVELMRLAAMVGDGHSNVSPWRDTTIAFRELPIAFYRFADGYHVQAATTAYRDLLGARVRRIGPVSVDSAERLVRSLVPRDNEAAVWLYAPVLLRMPEVLHAIGLSPGPGTVVVTLEVGGVERTVTLSPAGRFPDLSGDIDRSWNARPGWVDLRDRAPAPLWLAEPNATYWFRYLPESTTLYCQINTIQQDAREPIDAFLARAIGAADSAGAGRFVLDLRRNGGGNGFYNRAILRALVRSRYDEPGRLFVITGRRTFSAAQMLITHLERWANPIFVGEPSSSKTTHYGDSRRLVLPNQRITVRVSTLYWQLDDPRDDRPWIAPDVAAALTAASYAAGRDPALEAIAAYRPGPSLVDLLEPALQARDATAARQTVAAFAANPVNAWHDVRRTLDDLRRRLAAANRATEAELVRELGAWWAAR